MNSANSHSVFSTTVCLAVLIRSLSAKPYIFTNLLHVPSPPRMYPESGWIKDCKSSLVMHPPPPPWNQDGSRLDIITGLCTQTPTHPQQKSGWLNTADYCPVMYPVDD